MPIIGTNPRYYRDYASGFPIMRFGNLGWLGQDDSGISTTPPTVGTDYAGMIATQAGQTAICLGPTINGQENQVDCNDPTCTYGDCGSNLPAATGPLCLGPTVNGVESQIDCNDPNCTYGDCIQTPTTPAAGVPTGTNLTYIAQLAAQLFTSQNANQVLSGISGSLPSSGLTVINSNYSSQGLTSWTVQLTVQVTGSGFATTADAKSVIDGAFYAQMKQMPLSSTISVGGTAAAGPGAGGTAQNLAATLEQNLPWIIGGLVLIVTLPAIIKKV
jgi:hypothetical protein